MTKARGLPFEPKERRKAAPYTSNNPARYHPWQLVLSRHPSQLNTELLHLGTYVPDALQVEVVSIFGAHGYKSPSVVWQHSDPNFSWVSHSILLGDRDNNLELIADLLPYAFIRSHD